MIPARWLFRSKWVALFWAAGICFSAARFAETGTDAGGKAADADALANVAAAIDAAD